MQKSFFVTLVAAFFLCLVSAAVADDWVAVKLRGQVLAYDGATWQPLKRGDVVSDQRPVRTGGSGRVTFQRDAEVIDVGSNTQIQIVDKAGRHFTTVKQAYGEVSVQANVENVQHFAVQTPMLVAVVKGTRFTVISTKSRNGVAVQRGHVAVQATGTHQSVVVAAGQSVQLTRSGGLSVTGKGKLPQVLDRKGKAVGGEKSNKGGQSGSHGKDQGNSGAGAGNGGGNGTSNEGQGNGHSGGGGGNGNGGGSSDNSGSSNSGGNGNGNGKA